MSRLPLRGREDRRDRPNRPVESLNLLLPAAAALIVGALWLYPSALTAGEARFVAGLVDVPLMPGLSDTPTPPLVFDKPEGRIAEARATGPVALEAARSFYAQSLEQLGWRARGAGRYLRDGEMLSLEFAKAGDEVEVRFTITPVPRDG